MRRRLRVPELPGRTARRSRGSTEKAVATAEPSRQASPVSSAAIRRSCQGVAPAGRRSRCTAPVLAHGPRNPSTGTSRSSRLTITPNSVRRLGQSLLGQVLQTPSVVRPRAVIERLRAPPAVTP
ncbi:hypothetical protein ACWKT3_14440 [Streptomyces violaceus]